MTPSEESLRKTTNTLFKNYRTILLKVTKDPLAENPRLSIENLLWMCEEGINSGDALPFDKVSRWLGFIQGCLAMRMLIDVDEERDISRPMFREGYALTGSLPETLERQA